MSATVLLPVSSSSRRLTLSAELLRSSCVHPTVAVTIAMRPSFKWDRLAELVADLGSAVSSALGKNTSGALRKTFIDLATAKANVDSFPTDSGEYKRLHTDVGKNSRGFLFTTRDELCVLVSVVQGLFIFVKGVDGTVTCPLHVLPGNRTFTGQFSCITTATLCFLNAVVQMVTECYLPFDVPDEDGLSVSLSTLTDELLVCMNTFTKSLMSGVMGANQRGTAAAAAAAATASDATDGEAAAVAVPLSTLLPSGDAKKRRRVAAPPPLQQPLFYAAAPPPPPLPAAMVNWSPSVLTDVAAFVRSLNWSADQIYSAALHVSRMTPVAAYPLLTQPIGVPRLDAAAELALLRLLSAAQTVHFTPGDLAVWQELAKSGAAASPS